MTARPGNEKGPFVQTSRRAVYQTAWLRVEEAIKPNGTKGLFGLAHVKLVRCYLIGSLPGVPDFPAGVVPLFNPGPCSRQAWHDKMASYPMVL
jgi:hypothetical protein